MFIYMLYTYIYYTYTFAYVSNVVKSLHVSELLLHITPLDIPRGITSVRELYCEKRPILYENFRLESNS